MGPRRVLLSLCVAALVVGSTSVTNAATEKCAGLRATITGTSGNNEIQGTDGNDVIAALGGNDVIFSNGGNDIICAGGGADEVYAGPDGDLLLGQGGDDTLVGDAGADEMNGAGGNDYFDGGPDGDVIAGGRGAFDQADFRTSQQGVDVDLTAERATGNGSDALTGIEMVTGSPFDDTLTGADGAFELFRPLTGNDTIDGNGGVDQLLFDESQASVTADAANGSASGEGSDTFTAVESLVGSEFGDTLRGDSESNDLYGFGGDDVLDGRDGNDYLLGHAGNDQIAGGDGAYDMIDFESDAPPVTIHVPAGTVTGEGSDQISGLEIFGASRGDDSLIGGDADELFYPYGGNDAIDGGGGSDLVLYDVAPGPMDIDLAADSAHGQGADTLAAIEGAVGSTRGDVMTGDDAGNLLIGGGGNDKLNGGGGDDYFEGGPGNDRITGGPGAFDMINFFGASRRVVADLLDKEATGQGDDALIGLEILLGSEFSDALFGDDGDNYLEGRAGDDDLLGRAGDDIIDGGPGGNGINGGAGTDVCLPAGGTDCESQDGSAPDAINAAEQAEEVADALEQLKRRHL